MKHFSSLVPRLSSLVLTLLFCGHCTRASIAVEPVTVEEKQVEITVPASLIPSDIADIRFQRELKVDRVFVDVGDPVNAGDPLIQLAGEALTLQMNQLKAQLREQELTLEKNNFLYRSRDRLLEEGKIDQTQFDGVAKEVEAGEATIERLRIDLSLLEAQTKSTSIVSPISGIVTEKNTSSGLTTPAGQAALKVIRSDPIYASFTLPATEADTVTIGMNVTIQLEDLPNQNLAAQVNHISPEIDPATKSFEVWASIANPNRFFKSGMKGIVRFDSATKRRFLLVPKESVWQENGQQFVYAVVGGRAQKRRIYPKNAGDAMVEIAEGLSQGDVVIIKGLDKIQEGASVDAWK